MNSLTECVPITIPLTTADRQQAQTLAQQQSSSAQSEKVYRNLLAVLATRRYLQLLDIETNLTASHSWNAASHLLTDVSDLYLPEAKSRLECRAITPGADRCFFPPEVWSDRIGYVVVAVDPAAYEAQILGFVPTVTVESLPLSYLQPLDQLIDRLDQPPVIDLSQWLTGIVEAGWQTVEALIKPRSQVLEFRGVAHQDNTPQELATLIQTTTDHHERWQAAEQLRQLDPSHPVGGVWQAIDLGLQFQNYRIALVVAVLSHSAQQRSVLLRLTPIGDSVLPPELQLIVLDDTEQVLQQRQSRGGSQALQLYFTADPGDRFNLKVALGNASLTEHFMV